ncbi:acyltransferase family protein [Bradyrhizobium sp. Ai1a-2]|uniref:acyltransferase family protein n=1 Tax=Bradyrhizobium sp. Ai1a-2 TaxID=196490 RepID=UPI0031B8473C
MDTSCIRALKSKRCGEIRAYFASAALAILLTAVLQFFGVPDATSDPFTASVQEIINTNPLGRLFEFCLGMSGWVLWKRYLQPLSATVTAWTIAELMALAFAMFWCLDAYWNVRVSLPAIFGPWFAISGPSWSFLIVVIVFAGGKGLTGRILNASPLVLLGQMSFSVYMLHQILMKIYFTHDLVDQPSIVFFAPLLAMSALSFFLIETPARNFFARIVHGRATVIVRHSSYSSI